MNNLLLKSEPSRLAGPVLTIAGLTVFAPLIDGGTTQGPFMVIRLVLVGALVAWFISGLRFSALAIPHTLVWWPVAGFLSLAGLSVLWTSYLHVSVNWFLSILLYAVFFGIVLRGANSIARVRDYILLILAMGVLEGGFGIIQYLFLGEARARGTFYNPNYFATYESVSAALAFGLLAGGSKGADFRTGEKPFLALVMAISCGAVMLAQSRGGTVAFLLAMTFVGLFRYGKAALAVLLLLVLAGIIFPNPVKQRIVAVATYDPYAYTRVEIWKDSLARLVDHPMGIGLGTYKFASFQYRFPNEETIVRYGKRAEAAHNEYLQLAVELGIVGLALFLAGIGVWAYEAKRLLQGKVSGSDHRMAVGLCAGVSAIVIHASVDSVFHEPALVLLAVLLVGLVLALGRISGVIQSGDQRFPFVYHPIRVAGVILTSTLLAFLVVQPAAAWFASQRGDQYIVSGDSVGAIEWYQRAVLIDPGSTAIRDGIARLYLHRFNQSGDAGWILQAVDHLKISMVLNPLDGRVPYRLGTLYILLADQPALRMQRDRLIGEAVGVLEKAIKVDPYSPFSYAELAKLRRMQGEIISARQLLERAIGYEPNFLPVRAMLADLAKETGQIVMAESHLAAIHDIRSKYQGWTLTPIERQFLGISAPTS